MSRTVQKYNIYKGKGKGTFGAIQFTYRGPHAYRTATERGAVGQIERMPMSRVSYRHLREGWQTREGCIMVEAASATAPDVYDWSDGAKVVMALSITDCGAILHYIEMAKSMVPEKPLNLYHDPHQGTDRQGETSKSFKITSPQGSINGCMIEVSQKQNGTMRTHRIPMNGAELMVLELLIKSVIPEMLNWTSLGADGPED